MYEKYLMGYVRNQQEEQCSLNIYFLNYCIKITLFYFGHVTYVCASDVKGFKAIKSIAMILIRVAEDFTFKLRVVFKVKLRI